MPLVRLLEWVAGHHLLPALFASIWLGLGLLAIFYVLRVRRADDRVPFLYAALLKVGLAMWVGEGLSCLDNDPRRYGYFGLRWPHFLPGGLPLEVHAKASAADSWIVSAAIIGTLAAGLLLYRWSRVAPVYRRLCESRRAPRRDFAEVIQIFEGLVSQAFRRSRWLPRPRLMILYEAPSPAFTMGIRPPVVVLSAELAGELGAEQVAGILAHELAHIRRWDYLARWLATILRDVLIWNPLAHMWYQGVLDLQEKASDSYAAELVGDPDAVASGLIEMGAFLTGVAPRSPASVAARGGGHDLRQLSERVDLLIEARSSPPPRATWADALRSATLVLFVLAQPHIVISVPYVYGLLRSWLG